MSNLRVLDPASTDAFESPVRRFFSPAVCETETPPLKMRIDASERDGKTSAASENIAVQQAPHT